MAAFRLLQDAGFFRSFSPDEYLLEERTVRAFISSIDVVRSTIRHLKKNLLSIFILNIYICSCIRRIAIAKFARPPIKSSIIIPCKSCRNSLDS